MNVAFLLNSKAVRVELSDPHTTTLNWLREKGYVGSKEGCGEGDCGACTAVMGELVDGEVVLSPINTCIQLLSRLNGRALITIEGVQDTPLQAALVDEHASQCGYCTPGFVMSMYYGINAAPPKNREEACDLIAGNLCRCTGYQGLLRVAMGLQDMKPDYLAPMQHALKALRAPVLKWQPHHLREALELRSRYPHAQIVAGNTDVGLWITKRQERFDQVLMLHEIAELHQIHRQPDSIQLGAMVSYAAALPALIDEWPQSARYLKRIGSTQVRAAGTIGGNIANGSPIGDMPPMLIALEAQVVLASVRGQRSLPLEQFFLEYGVQDLAVDELLTRLDVPVGDRVLHCAKLSKRADQDISAVSLGLSGRVVDGCLHDPIVAMGGMAGVPKRASHLEAAIHGQPIEQIDFEALGQDFQPMSDARASAEYRLKAAQGMVKRGLMELLV